MNTTVSATGMQVKAKSEGGLLIAIQNTDAATWSDTIQFTTSAPSLVPVSTATCATNEWFHASSTSNTSPNKKGEGSLVATDYTTPTITESANVGSNGDTHYYLVNRCYIKSATVGSEMAGINVTALTVSGSTNSAALNSSLRVAVKIGSVVKIFAPIALAEGEAQHSSSQTHLQYNVKATTPVTAVDASTSFAAQNLTADNISAVSADATLVSIYVYFEGEDGGCVSGNVVTNLDTLSIGVSFSATGPATNS